MVADHRHLCVQTFITGIAAIVKNDWQKTLLGSWGDDITVPDPGKGVCADPVNRGAILEGGGPGPPGGNKERQLSPEKGRGKT